MAKAEKIRLDIPVLLSGVEDVKDLCVARLISRFSGATASMACAKASYTVSNSGMAIDISVSFS